MEKITIILLFFATMLISCEQEVAKPVVRYTSDSYYVTKIEFLGNFYDESYNCVNVSHYNNFFRITLSNSYNSVEFVTTHPSQYTIGAEILK